MTTEQQNELYEKLTELGSEELLNLITDYHGLQLLDDGFANFAKDELDIDIGLEEEK